MFWMKLSNLMPAKTVR